MAGGFSRGGLVSPGWLGGSRTRALSRWLLPAGGAAAAVVLAAGSAHAATASGAYTGPANPTTADTLTWAVTTDDPTTTSCELDRDATTLAGPEACSTSYSYDVAGGQPGTYTLVVYGVAAADVVPGTTTGSASGVTVAPPAPTPSAPPASASTTPSWTLGLPTGYPSGTCTVTDASSAVVVGPEACTSPYPSDLGATAATGDYTLHVTVSANGVTSAEGTATYTLTPPAPTTPTISRAAAVDSNPTPSFTVTEPDADATLTCAVSGTSATVSACGATTTLDLTAAADGVYTLTVTATNTAGGTSSATFDYTLDRSAPSTVTVTAPPSPAQGTQPVFTVAESDTGVTFTCVLTRPDSSTRSVSGCGAGQVSVTLGAGDGLYTLTVTVTDAAGNSTGGSASYTLDSAAPTTPTISRLKSVDRNRTPSFTVTEPDSDATLSCTVTAPATVTLCGSTTTIDLSGLVDGVYTLTVTATDPAGNTSSATFAYTLDTGAPTTPTITRSKSVDKTRTPSFTVTEPDSNATLSCTVTGAGASVTTCGPTTTLSLTGADGDYVLTVTATDPAGNSSAASFTYTLDTVAPSTPTVSRSPSVDRTRTPSFTVTGVDADATLSCTVTGAGASVTTCGPTTTLSLTGADGDYVLTVTATDPAGNTASATFTYTLDATPPTKPTVSRATSVDNDPNPSFTVTEPDPDATLSCTVSGGAVLTLCGPTTTLDLSGLPDGSYVLTVTATDAVGNSISTTFTYTFDTTPPTKPTISRSKSVDKNRTPSFSVTGVDADATLSCTVTGTGAGVTLCGPTTTLSLTGADGDYVLTVTATDPAGNTTSATFTYTLDTTPPPPPAIAPVPARLATKQVTVGISDSEAGVALTCLLRAPGGGTVFTGTCPGSGGFDTTGFGDGIYTLTVTATDPAGNSSSSQVSWERDTTPPPPPVITGPGAFTNDTTPTLGLSDTETTATLTCELTGPSGASVFSGGCPADGTFTTDDGDGTYSLVVTATDELGNASSSQTTWVLDTVPPPAPAVVKPRDPSNLTQPAVGISDTESGVVLSCVLTEPGGGTVTYAACPATFDTRPYGDGLYTLAVTATDAASNTTTTTVTWIRDTLPPPAPTVSPPAPLTKSRTVTLTISDSEPGVVLTCVLRAPDGSTVFSGACPADGLFDTTGHGDGVYTLVVTATDAATNFSTTTVTWTRDTIPPPVPSVTGPARQPAQDRAPAFTVSDTEAGVTYTCTVTGPGSARVSACGSTSRLDLTGSPDGTYTLTVTATDPAGNVSGSASAGFTLDTTPPVTPAVTPTPSPSQGRTVTYTSTGVEPGGVLACALTGPAGSTVTVASACTATVTINLAGQPDGTYTLSVTVTDAAGNVSSAGTASYRLDTTPPAAPGVLVPPSPGNDTTPTLTIAAEPGATVTCTIARFFKVVGAVTCTTDGTLDLGAYQDGEFEITVTVTDAAGNVSPATTVTYLLDTLAPVTPELTEPASPSPIERPEWLFTAEPDAIATCTVTDAAGTVVQGPVACAGTFTGAFRLLPDGTYTLSVVVTDAAGNASVPALSVFVLDRTAPVPPTVTPPPPSGSDKTPTWKIRAPRGAVLTCTLLGGRSVLYAGECPSDGVFSLRHQPDGTYTLRVTATDSAGNVSAASVSEYVLDTVSPAVPRLDYASPSPSTNTNPYWGFTLPAGAAGRCQLTRDGTVLATKTCSEAVSFDLSGRSPGTYVVVITAVDAAGNTSRSLQVSYILGAPSSPPPPASGGSAPPPPASAVTAARPQVAATTGPTHRARMSCRRPPRSSRRSPASGS